MSHFPLLLSCQVTIAPPDLSLTICGYFWSVVTEQMTTPLVVHSTLSDVSGCPFISFSSASFTSPNNPTLSDLRFDNGARVTMKRRKEEKRNTLCHFTKFFRHGIILCTLIPPFPLEELGKRNPMSFPVYQGSYCGKTNLS